MLPADHLLGIDHDDPWDDDHNVRLTEALQSAASRTEAEDLHRKQRLDRKAAETGLPMGTGVFLRNRAHRG